uniref:Uncharacterized protein n=1 Tax=Magallana gigas TaxID=29159 RepID=K1PLR0_MAGGI
MSAVILLEEVMLVCEWTSCCEDEDEVAVSATGRFASVSRHKHDVPSLVSCINNGGNSNGS